MIIYRCDVCDNVTGEIAKLTAPNLNLDICYLCQIEIPNIITGRKPFTCFICRMNTKKESVMIKHLESKKHIDTKFKWERYEEK